MTNKQNPATLESVLNAAEQNLEAIEQVMAQAMFAGDVTPGNFRAATMALQIAQNALMRAALACSAELNLTAADRAVAEDPRA